MYTRADWGPVHLLPQVYKHSFQTKLAVLVVFVVMIECINVCLSNVQAFHKLGSFSR